MKTPFSTRLRGGAYSRFTHQAVSGATSSCASPATSPNCQSARPRNCSMSKLSGTRKSRSRRVANLISERIRETRKFLTTESPRSSPITYQVPFSGRSAKGLIVRSRSSSRPIDQ